MPSPSIENYPTFYNHKRELNGKCIFYIESQRRQCKRSLSAYNPKSTSGSYDRVIELRSRIENNVGDSLDDLRQYIRLNCCTQSHRLKIDDHDLVTPLAQRWCREIRDAQGLPHHDQNQDDIPCEESPSDTAQDSTDVIPTIIRLDRQTRYNLRPRMNTSEYADASDSQDISNPLFRPYKRNPKKSIAHILQDELQGEDCGKVGFIYIYESELYPGMVKIGWTCSIEGRFKNIEQKCGYKPRLLYSFSNVPNVRTTEKLIHTSLTTSWRVLRRCKGCGRSHREWFEIDAVSAYRVAQPWVQWMKSARPYGADHKLAAVWRDHRQRLQDEGIPLTGELLLELHLGSLAPSVAPQNTLTQVPMNPSASQSDAMRISHAIALLRIVLVYLEQVQVQQVLEQTFWSPPSPEMIVTRPSVSSFTADLLPCRNAGKRVLASRA